VETARSLAAHGANVVGAARDLAKADNATAQVRKDAADKDGSFELIGLDLPTLRVCVLALMNCWRKGNRLTWSLPMRGVMATPLGHTADGFETQFGTNHLGHFVLVNRIAVVDRRCRAWSGISIMCLGVATRTLILRINFRVSRCPRAMTIRRRTSAPARMRRGTVDQDEVA